MGMPQAQDPGGDVGLNAEEYLRAIINKDPQRSARERYQDWLGTNRFGRVGKRILDAFAVGASAFGKNPVRPMYQEILEEEMNKYKAQAPLAQQELNTRINAQQRDEASQRSADTARERNWMTYKKEMDRLGISQQLADLKRDEFESRAAVLGSQAALNWLKAEDQRIKNEYAQKNQAQMGTTPGSLLHLKGLASDPEASTGLGVQEMIKNAFNPRAGGGTSTTTSWNPVETKNEAGTTGWVYPDKPRITSTSRPGTGSTVDLSIIPGLMSGTKEEKQNIIKETLTGIKDAKAAVKPQPRTAAAPSPPFFPSGVSAPAKGREPIQRTAGESKVFGDAEKKVAGAKALRKGVTEWGPAKFQNWIGPRNNLQFWKMNMADLRNLVGNRSDMETLTKQMTNDLQWLETVSRTGAQLSINELQMAKEILPNPEKDSLDQFMLKSIKYDMLMTLAFEKLRLPPEVRRQLATEERFVGRINETAQKYHRYIMAGGKLPQNAFDVGRIFPELGIGDGKPQPARPSPREKGKAIWGY